jgi:hypothetical protein
LRVQRDTRVNDFQPPEISRIRVGLANDGALEIFFPAFRNPAIALGMLAFMIAWTAGTLMIFESGGPLIFKILWPLFQAMLGVWVLALVFVSTSVHVMGDEMTVTWRLLGIPVRRRHLLASEITDIRSMSGMYAGNTVYRRIQVRLKNQRSPLNFGDGIRDSIQADWIAVRIARILGLQDDANRGSLAGTG